MITFQHRYADLPDHFFANVTPSPAPKPKMIAVNDELASDLGFDSDFLRSSDGLALLSGNHVPEDSKPIAQAYAGHQFGGWVPQLGDGRAVLLGEVEMPDGRLFDIQLKGGGRTPFSRGGDGKSALGPVLREYIVSEAMHALGVPTTRALAAVSSGETVYREKPVAGGIFTRVASSHIRVGTFQFFLARGDVEGLRVLADHAISRHYPSAAGAESPYLALLEGVITAQAKLIAHWMSLGFIHGVMNTDNCAISGETIDYGPCAFIDDFHPEKVFSSIDRNGRYAWGNQPVIGHWNLTRFAETLLPLIDNDADVAKAVASDALDRFGEQFEAAFQSRFREKLGLSAESIPVDFVEDTLSLLAKESVDFTIFFRRLTQVASGVPETALGELLANPSTLAPWLEQWRALSPDVDMMKATNPVIIPRNHRIEEAIVAGYAGDFEPFHRLSRALATPFEGIAAHEDLEASPRAEEVVQATFCGT